jgi:hypothetical protein
MTPNLTATHFLYPSELGNLKKKTRAFQVRKVDEAVSTVTQHCQ